MKSAPLGAFCNNGLDPFCEKTIVLLKQTLFLARPHIQAIQLSCQLCSNVDIKDSWACQILQRAHKNFKWPIKIWKLVCIIMGHWPILRANHHFGLGLSLDGVNLLQASGSGNI